MVALASPTSPGRPMPGAGRSRAAVARIVLCQVRWASVPDPRRPFIKDFHLACGHVLVHRPLPRGADGRMHMPARLRCPWCAEGAVARHRPHPHPPVRMAAVRPVEPAPAPVAAVAEDAEPIALHPWSPRDLASRNWE